MKGTLDASIKDIFKAIDKNAAHIPVDISVPNDFYQELLDYFLERGYLNALPERKKFVDFRIMAKENPGLLANITKFKNEADFKNITWLKVERLPIHPNEAKEYDLLSRWQSVLSTLHTWGHRLIFLMQRKNGETNLYLGTTSLSRSSSSKQALEQFKEAASSGMPGIDLRPILSDSEKMDFVGNLVDNDTVGAITGIPSLKKDTQFGVLQTLDQLAFGIRDINGNERDYSFLVIADPVNDETVSRTISKFRRLGSEIHLDVSRNISEGENQSESKSSNLGIGAIMGAIGGMFGLGNISRALLSLFSKSASTSAGVSQSVSTQYLDKFAQYAEEITDKHCVRLNKGRNLGFWNAGIYVLGKSNRDINTVMGMLRAVYSGDESFVEPIRVHILRENSGALNIVKRCSLIPLVSDKLPTDELDKDWGLLGEMYQYVSTPLNTEELSIATSLPRRDVPGLRFVKTSVRFANNPAETKGDTIVLGKVVDTGVVQSNEYRIDPNALVRHAIVAGSTGSGKSTTCKTIIKEVLNRNIPVMIIEPAKDDYVRWAIEYNKQIEADNNLSGDEKEHKKFQIYMPGTEIFEGVQTRRLKLNPFQPAAIKDAPVDMMTRCEQATALINASLPNADVLPVLIDESIYRYLHQQIGEPFMNGDMPALQDYPRLDGVIQTAKKVLSERGYDKKVQDDIRAALETRFSYLTRGKRGDILNVNSSTDYDRLFGRPTVINVSKIANAKDKALIMSMLTLSLYEYRISAYTYNEEYRRKAQKNQLLHLTVIEEAHNLLSKPVMDTSNSGNPQQVVADLFSNMLSEIRSYGQGIMIVDQIPTRLVADAIKNTNYKIVHRLTAPDDCSAMSAGLALREDQEKVIPALGIGDAIICGDLDDAAAWVRLNGPDKKRGAV